MEKQEMDFIFYSGKKKKKKKGQPRTQEGL